MQNRQPTPGQEGRVLITPEDGTASFYAKISMADNPTQEGTPYNKQSVLQDVTCDAIGIPHTSTPNEAFLALAIGVGRYGYLIHVQFPDGSPAEGFTITGITGPDGSAPVTDSNGDAVGVSTNQDVSVGVNSPYIDIEGVTAETIQSTGILTPYTITLSQKTDYVTITSSQQILLSQNVKTFDLCAVGGGGPGGGQYTTSRPGGSGGGGGYVTNVLGISADNNRTLNVSIGAGGTYIGGNMGEIAGSAGGTTTVTSGQTQLISANGGQPGRMGSFTYPVPGGAGNGKGGDYIDLNAGPENGSNGTVNLFNDPLLGLPGGGGGGAGNQNSNDGYASGGSPYGGRGAGNNGNAVAGRGPGGGGGAGGDGGNQHVGNRFEGANGSAGAVYFRFHF